MASGRAVLLVVGVAAFVLTACSSSAPAALADTPIAAPATLWTQYGRTPVTDATDVTSLGTSLMWLDTAGKVWTGRPAENGDIGRAQVAGLPDGIVDVDGGPSGLPRLRLTPDL